MGPEVAGPIVLTLENPYAHHAHTLVFYIDTAGFAKGAKPMSASARRRWDGSVEFTLPFTPPWVDQIKEEIPWKYREWDAERRIWTIQSPYSKRALDLTRQYFPGLQIIDLSSARPHAGQSAPPPPPPPPPTPLRPDAAAYRALHLQPSAPTAVVEAVYRALSRQAHPDMGGDDERQRELNRAIEVLRDRRAAS